MSRKGFLQAAAFYDTYKHIPFQKVYTSELARTKQTVKQFVEDGIPFESLAGLDEICWGESEGLFANGSDNRKYYAMIEAWKQGNTHLKLEGGESPIDLKIRQEEAINYILSQPEDLVLVCMHGRAMKILLAWITGKDVKYMDDYDHDNLSLYILRYENNKFHIDLHDERAHVIK